MRFVLFAILLFFLSGPYFDTLAQADSRKCVIKTMVGTVKIRRGGTINWVDARPRMALKERDAVRTFIESEAELETTEGSLINVGENSTIELARYREKEEVRTTRLKIMNGKLLSNVKKLVNTKSSFDFETPTATASIRGTLVSFDVSKEHTRVKVFSGKVLVVPQGAKQGTELKENQMTTVVKGQKDVKVEKLDEKPPVPVQNIKADSTAIDSLPADSSRTSGADSVSTKPLVKDTTIESDTLLQGSSLDNFGTDTSDGENAVASLITVKPVSLEFSVTSPRDGQMFVKPLIPVIGTVTAGAEVTAMSVKLPLASQGARAAFNGQVPIANEEGELILELEASLDGKTQKITRRVIYRPEFRFILSTPQDRQTVSNTLVQIRGEVLPSNAEVTVQGKRMSVSSGTFSGFINIPDEEGDVQLEFEINAGSLSKAEMRTITYKRPPDIIRPVLQGVMPVVAQYPKLAFTVVDRTIDEEITFCYEIDGRKETETGAPNSPFSLPLEEGIHTYVAYAVDKAGNQSQKLTQKISYIGSSTWLIKMRRPIGDDVINLPPSTPDGSYRPRYTIEFSIENLPDDDMQLIKEIAVTNSSTGEAVRQRSFSDNYFQIDIGIIHRATNQIIIEVLDVNNTIKKQSIQVHVR